MGVLYRRPGTELKCLLNGVNFRKFLKGLPLIPSNIYFPPKPKEAILSKKEVESYNECEKEDDDKSSSKSIQNTSIISQAPCQLENSLKVPIEIQHRLDRLMKKFPNGISCIELLEQYRYFETFFIEGVLRLNFF